MGRLIADATGLFTCEIEVHGRVLNQAIERENAEEILHGVMVLVLAVLAQDEPWPAMLIDWMDGEGTHAFKGCATREDRSICIETLEGVMSAQPGDWIIQGVQGEFYPCKPDIFEQTYEEFQPPVVAEGLTPLQMLEKSV